MKWPLLLSLPGTPLLNLQAQMLAFSVKLFLTFPELLVYPFVFPQCSGQIMTTELCVSPTPGHSMKLELETHKALNILSGRLVSGTH